MPGVYVCLIEDLGPGYLVVHKIGGICSLLEETIYMITNCDQYYEWKRIRCVSITGGN